MTPLWIKISDHHKVEVVVGTADYIQINMASAEYGELEVSKILMFVTNGDQDILEDETCNDNNIVYYILWRY